MTGGQWETVGKPKKAKTKGNASKIPTKNQEIIETSGPIAESVTLYNALLDREKQEALAAREAAKAAKEDAKQPEKNAKKKNKADKKAPKPLSMEEAFKQVGDLSSHVATLEVLYPISKYPDAPLLYLKDIASLLNLKVDLPVEDPIFASKPQGYPSSLLQKRSVMTGLFHRCPLQTLHAFYESCLRNMVQDTLKGLPTLGYRIMLQSLAQEFPQVVLHNLPKSVELCRAHLNRQNVCLSVFWASAQAANKNLKAGFRVWVDLMLPFIASKHCTNFAIDFLEKMISRRRQEKVSVSVLEVRDLFSVLDLLHSKEHLPKNLQKRLSSLYPDIKAACYGAEPELRNYFPSYLKRLGTPALREEVLESLLHCLEQDPHCFSVWRQLYAKHQAESACLLSYLNERWVPSKKFPVRHLKETLRAFLLTADARNTRKQMEALLLKLDSVSFRWLRLVPLILFLLSSALAYDLWLHKSLEASVSGRFLKDSGLLALGGQAGHKTHYLYREASKLSAKYIPWLRSSVDVVLAKSSEAAVVGWKSTRGFREWCGQVLPPVLQTAEGYCGHLLTWTKQGIILLSKGTVLVTTQLLEGVDAFAVWVQSSPQMMSALQSTVAFLASVSSNVQESAGHLFQLAKSYVP